MADSNGIVFYFLQLFILLVRIVMWAPAVSEIMITMAANKHLTNEERSQTEHLLHGKASSKEIARILGKLKGY